MGRSILSLLKLSVALCCSLGQLPTQLCQCSSLYIHPRPLAGLSPAAVQPRLYRSPSHAPGGKDTSWHIFFFCHQAVGHLWTTCPALQGWQGLLVCGVLAHCCKGAKQPLLMSWAQIRDSDSSDNNQIDALSAGSPLLGGTLCCPGIVLIIPPTYAILKSLLQITERAEDRWQHS